MKQSLASAAVLLALAATLTGCSSGRGDERLTQSRFGVRMARMNLWREALFRFQRAAQMKPEDALAHNNLAVAYEANGDFDNAAREYREAIRLDKSNQFIQKNYSRFVEFTSRNKKRQQRAAASAPAPAPAATATAPGASTPAPAPAPAPVPPPPAPTPETKPPGGQP